MEDTEGKYFEAAKDIKMSDIIEDGITDTKASDSVKTDITDLITVAFTFFAIYFTVAQNYENTVGYSISIVYFLFFVFTAGTVVFREKCFRKEAVFPCVLLIIVYASFSLFTGYDILRMLLSCYLFGYTICALKGISVFPVKSIEDAFFQLSSLFFIPIKNVFLPLAVFFRKIKNLRKGNNKKLIKVGGILLGFILAIPVFIVVSKLLEDADFAFRYVFSAFSDKFSRILTKLTEDIPLNLDNLLPALLLTPFVFSFIFCAKHGITKNVIDKKSEKNMIKKLAVVNSSIVFGFCSLISLVYIIFMVSQLSYLFAAFSGELPFGYSVSGYARQGFFEMSAVAAINFGLIILGEIFIRRTEKGGLPEIRKYFSLFFCIFTLLLIIIAAAKMLLYVNTYGLTEKRIAVLIADIVLFITFILTAIKLFRKNLPNLKTAFYSVAIAVTLLLVLPTDSLAASFNTQMYLTERHTKIDTEQIRHSDSLFLAALNLNKLADSDSTLTADNAKKRLYALWLCNKDYVEKPANIDSFLFKKFIEKYSDRIQSFSSEYNNGYFIGSGNAPETYLKTEQNFISANIYLTLDMPEYVTAIKFENSLFKKEIKNNDGSPLSYGQKISVYDWCTLDGNGEFAVITIYLENGEAHSFELRKDRFFVSENTERCFYVGKTDYVKGTIKAKPDGHIYFVIGY